MRAPCIEVARLCASVHIRVLSVEASRQTQVVRPRGPGAADIRERPGGAATSLEVRMGELSCTKRHVDAVHVLGRARAMAMKQHLTKAGQR